MTYEKILKRIADLKLTPSGPKHYRISKDIYRLCRKNRRLVSQMILGEIGELNEKIRSELLFKYSVDHRGSARLKDNPEWTQMVIDFIIPQFSKLVPEMKIMLKHYFRDCSVDIESGDREIIAAWIHKIMWEGR